ncbi:MAG: hypothetical protein KDK63_00155, partial [Chlamydiia bacterium]|nr:hypothetical protein [Chlamydiia bacterium]
MTISDLNSFESKTWIQKFNYTKELSDSQTFYSQSFSLLDKQNTKTIINVKAIINEPGRKNKLDNEIHNERNGDSFVWISLAYCTDSGVRFLFASSLKNTQASLFRKLNALVESGNKVSNPPDMHDIEIDENTLSITPFEVLPDCPARDVKFLTIREMDEQSSWRKDSEGICAWR